MSTPKFLMKHCTQCTGRYAQEDIASPETRLTCRQCGFDVFFNPAPVSVALIRVGSGILGVRRNIKPNIGELALPGGFHNFGEDWKTAGSREVREETGLEVPASDIRLFDVMTGNGRHQLTFCEALTPLDQLPDFDPAACDETQELVVLDGSQDLCFPTHDEMYKRALDIDARIADCERELERLRAIARNR